MDPNITHRTSGKKQFVAQYQKLNATESEISLTPSQVLRRDKSNLQKKNPLDSITKAPKTNEFYEKRSGLQNVTEEHLQQSSTFFQRKSDFSARGEQPSSNANNNLGSSNQQDNNTPAAGAFSKQQANIDAKNLPPSEPIHTENSNATNASNEPEKGFCTTCPNCAARIILMPETSNKAEENSPSS